MHRAQTTLGLADLLSLQAAAEEAIDNPGPLVEADWLATNLETLGLVILDIGNGIDNRDHVVSSMAA